MSETKTTYEHKDLPALLITITSGTKLVRQIQPTDTDSIDLVISVVEKKSEAQKEG